MSNNSAEKIVTSIDSFVCSQVPQASEVTFDYEPSTDSDRKGYKVTVVSVYDVRTHEPVARREDLHQEGVAKMEDYLGTTLPVVLSSPRVLNLVTQNGHGKFGVALRNSEDNYTRTDAN